jgi:SHS2 domain-containing protein
MNSYKFLDHTADVLFQAEAASLNELFRQAALATFATMTDLDKVESKETIQFNLQANTLEYLLFDFLDELLTYKDSEILLLKDFQINVEQTADHKWKLQATCHGEAAKEQKHDLKLDVKAITLHLFEVKKQKDKWTCQVLLDI